MPWLKAFRLHTSLDRRKDTRPVKFLLSFEVAFLELMDFRSQWNVYQMKAEDLGLIFSWSFGWTFTTLFKFCIQKVCFDFRWRVSFSPFIFRLVWISNWTKQKKFNVAFLDERTRQNWPTAKLITVGKSDYCSKKWSDVLTNQFVWFLRLALLKPFSGGLLLSVFWEHHIGFEILRPNLFY